MQDSIGIVYLTFGESSGRGAMRSYSTLEKLGIHIPVANIGTVSLPGFQLIPWAGRDPWHPEEGEGKFYAGEIKPFLCDLSPFDLTLYIDADTEFKGDPRSGFEKLAKYDFLAWKHNQKVRQALTWRKSWWSMPGVFNTIAYAGETAQMFNTGVLFFRKNPNIRELFQDWYCEWLKFPVWDEQMAFLRAVTIHPEIQVGELGKEWNSKEVLPNQIIRHYFGTGRSRDGDPRAVQ